MRGQWALAVRRRARVLAHSASDGAITWSYSSSVACRIIGRLNSLLAHSYLGMRDQSAMIAGMPLMIWPFASRI